MGVLLFIFIAFSKYHPAGDFVLLSWSHSPKFTYPGALYVLNCGNMLYLYHFLKGVTNTTMQAMPFYPALSTQGPDNEGISCMNPKRLYKKELQSEKYEVMGGSV